ncbi:hypothetical protein NDA13_001554 [Ustilago tritici]|nr:hypothetical protein NDA13_001554 [Ustilago tritici]
MSNRQPPPATPSTSQITVAPLPPTTSPLLPTKTITTTILGHATTVIAQSFTDRVFITITQLSRFGVLYQASTSPSPSSHTDGSAAAPTTTAANLPPPLPTTIVTKLVGTEPTPGHVALYQLYVSQVASIVHHAMDANAGRSVVVSLALKASASADGVGKERGRGGGQDWDDDEAGEMLMSSEDERQRFVAIMGLVQQCRVW